MHCRTNGDRLVRNSDLEQRGDARTVTFNKRPLLIGSCTANTRCTLFDACRVSGSFQLTGIEEQRW